MTYTGFIEENNFVDIHESADVKTCNFNVRGKNNRVVVEQNAIIRNSRIKILSDNNDVVISSGCRITANIIMKITDKNELRIGKNTSCGGANIICGEGTKIIIGDECMLAWGIEIRSTDSHAIIDKITGARVNSAEDIEINNHVWVGAHATILRGTLIPEDSIVGIRAVVKKKVTEKGSVIVGSPAKVVKEGVTWDRQLIG